MVWDSGGSDGSHWDSTSIQAQRFDPAGTPVGEEFLVNTYTTSSQGDSGRNDRCRRRSHLRRRPLPISPTLQRIGPSRRSRATTSNATAAI